MDKELGRILIVDDDKDVLFALNMLLKPLAEAVRVLLSPARLEEFVTDFAPHIVLLDMNFTLDTVSGEEGMACLDRIRKLRPETAVVMMTAFADTDKAVRCIKAGAADFVTKPWTNERLVATLRAAARMGSPRTPRLSHPDSPIRTAYRGAGAHALPAVASRSRHPASRLIGESDGIRAIRDMVERLRDTDVNVLLLGENGTGKDVVAHLLHERSHRRAAPMVSIDMGALTETLFESELFGHERGAFTDARQAKPGRFELAHGGTLFLDEVGNLSPSMQSKLLTVLEARRMVRVGGTKNIDVDVRLVCATNADLRAKVAEGTFRQDLYYRVNTIELHIPPLRDRGHDIQLLADHFLALYATKYAKSVTAISPAARQILQRYPWPGNVRELQHCIERAVVLAQGDTLQHDDFLLYEPPAPPPGWGAHALPDCPIRTAPSRQLTAEREPTHYGGRADTLNLAELERRAVETALQQADGNINRAAELLGITRFALYRKMEKLGTNT